MFLKIADAVNAAHLRGIVHRDLKPSNIRIDPHEEPHILDFGLAHAGVGSAGMQHEGQPVTITGQFIGSLPWASPEQAEGIASKIDVRSDVYSLGVILYQMLTGQFPYEVAGMMRDILDNILTKAPLPPSCVIAGQRGKRGTPQSASWKGMAGWSPELAAITLKALAKDPEDRYHSAGELGRDIASLLCGRPTIVGAPAAARKRKLFAAMRTAALIAITVSLSALVSWVVVHHKVAPDLVRPSALFPIGAGGEQDISSPLRNPFDDLDRNHIPVEEEQAAIAWSFRPGIDTKRELPEGLVAILGDSRLKHWNRVTGIAADGGTVATASEDFFVQLWNTDDGRARTSGLRHKSAVRTVTLRGNTVVTTSGTSAYLWELGKDAPLRTFDEAATGAIFASHADPLLTWSDTDNKLRLYSHPSQAIPAERSIPLKKPVTAAISGLGYFIAASSDDGTLSLWKAAGETLLWSKNPKRKFNSLSFSNDAKALVAAGDEGSVVYDVTTGTVIKELRSVAAAFSPTSAKLAEKLIETNMESFLSVGDIDAAQRITAKEVHTAADNSRPVVSFVNDDLVASASESGITHLWDVRAKFQRDESWQTESGEQLTALAVEPHGNLIAAASRGGFIRLWDIPSCRERRPLRVNFKDVECLAFSHDGSKLACGDHDYQVCIFDPYTGQLLHRCGELAGYVRAVAFSPDDAIIAAVRQIDNGDEVRYSVTLYNASSGDAQKTLSYEYKPRPVTKDAIKPVPVSTICFTPDGNALVLGFENGTVAQWDKTSDKAQTVQCPSAGGSISAISFIDDHKFAYCSATAGTLHRADLGSAISESDFLTNVFDVVARRVNGDEGLLLCCGHDGTVRLLDGKEPLSKAPRHVYNLGPPGGRIRQARFTFDGHYIATLNGNGTLYILRTPWNLWPPRRDGAVPALAQQVAQLRGHGGAVDRIDFSPRGTFVISECSDDNTTRIWEAGTGRLVKTFAPRGRVCFSADDSQMVIGALGAQRPTQVFDRGEWGKPRKSFEAFKGGYYVAISRDGSLIASNDDSNSLNVAEVETGKLIYRLPLGKDCSGDPSFSEDRKLLVLPVNWGWTQVWDLANGKRISEGHDLPEIRFSTNGQKLCRWGWSNWEICDLQDLRSLRPAPRHSPPARRANHVGQSFLCDWVAQLAGACARPTHSCLRRADWR